MRSMAAIRPEGLFPSAWRRPRDHWGKGLGKCCQGRSIVISWVTLAGILTAVCIEPRRLASQASSLSSVERAQPQGCELYLELCTIPELVFKTKAEVIDWIVLFF